MNKRRKVGKWVEISGMLLGLVVTSVVTLQDVPYVAFAQEMQQKQTEQPESAVKEGQIEQPEPVELPETEEQPQTVPQIVGVWLVNASSNQRIKTVQPELGEKQRYAYFFEDTVKVQVELEALKTEAEKREETEVKTEGTEGADPETEETEGTGLKTEGTEPETEEPETEESEEEQIDVYVLDGQSKEKLAKLSYDEEAKLYEWTLPADYDGTLFLRAENGKGKASPVYEVCGKVRCMTAEEHLKNEWLDGEMSGASGWSAQQLPLYAQAPQVRMHATDGGFGISQIEWGIFPGVLDLSEGQPMRGTILQLDADGRIMPQDQEEARRAGFAITDQKENLVLEIDWQPTLQQSDGVYTYWAKMTDHVGHAFYFKQTYCVDLTNPEVYLGQVPDSGVTNQTIVPEVFGSDANLQEDGICVQLFRNGKELIWSKGDLQSAQRYTVSWFQEHTQAGDDGSYTLTVTAKDRAGHTTQKSRSFVINRFGSAYAWSEAAQKLRGTYVKNGVPIVLSESNYSPLILEKTRILLTRNGMVRELQAGIDYQITQGIVEGRNRYEYQISEQVFAADGIYGIIAESVDVASNQNRSNDPKKGVRSGELNFGVDQTAPTILWLSKTDQICVKVIDNMQLDHVTMYVNEVERPYEVDKDRYMIRLSEQERNAKVTVQAVDVAGNQVEESWENPLNPLKFPLLNQEMLLESLDLQKRSGNHPLTALSEQSEKQQVEKTENMFDPSMIGESESERKNEEITKNEEGQEMPYIKTVVVKTNKAKKAGVGASVAGACIAGVVVLLKRRKKRRVC